MGIAKYLSGCKTEIVEPVSIRQFTVKSPTTMGINNPSCEESFNTRLYVTPGVVPPIPVANPWTAESANPSFPAAMRRHQY